jgi:Holliday junction resolvase RusA-like endonuclease
MADDSGGESESDTVTDPPPRLARLVLILARKPVSFNSGAKEKYKQAFGDEARARWGTKSLTGDLYARIVWFHRETRRGQDGDADNISKPILDALCGIAYADDGQILKRLVHKVDALGEYNISKERGDPRDVAELERLLGARTPHIIYFEVGRLESKSISFGPIDETLP